MYVYVLITLILGIFLNLSFTEGTTLITILIYLPIIGILFKQIRNVCLVFIYRAILPITIGLCSVWMWLSLQGNPLFSPLLRGALRDYAAVQDFFTILATLYAICIAFLLWKGLSDYDNLKIILREEANSIQSINDYLFYFGEDGNNYKIANNIRKIFVSYIGNISKGKKITTSLENDRFIKLCVNEVSKIKVKDHNDEIALADIMKLLNELSHIRSKRTSYIENKMSIYLLSVIGLISVALTIPFMLREPNANLVVHTLIFSLSSLFTFMFLTLLDINDPFDGYWEIKVESFERALANIKDDMGADAKPEE